MRGTVVSMCQVVIRNCRQQAAKQKDNICLHGQYPFMFQCNIMGKINVKIYPTANIIFLLLESNRQITGCVPCLQLLKKCRHCTIEIRTPRIRFLLYLKTRKLGPLHALGYLPRLIPMDRFLSHRYVSNPSDRSCRDTRLT